MDRAFWAGSWGLDLVFLSRSYRVSGVVGGVERFSEVFRCEASYF